MYKQMLRELGVSDAMPSSSILDSLSPRDVDTHTLGRGFLVPQGLYGKHVLTVDVFTKEMVIADLIMFLKR